MFDNERNEAEIKRRAAFNARHLMPVAVIVLLVCLLAIVMGPFFYLARCQVVMC